MFYVILVYEITLRKF
uniref:Uncharacterized protein n=1 Tax=Rhizophora mucronata TaxID=61149 RepID=A0A2P2Q8R3_RHIMU